MVIMDIGFYMVLVWMFSEHIHAIELISDAGGLM